VLSRDAAHALSDERFLEFVRYACARPRSHCGNRGDSGSSGSSGSGGGGGVEEEVYALRDAVRQALRHYNALDNAAHAFLGVRGPRHGAADSLTLPYLLQLHDDTTSGAVRASSYRNRFAAEYAAEYALLQSGTRASRWTDALWERHYRRMLASSAHSVLLSRLAAIAQLAPEQRHALRDFHIEGASVLIVPEQLYVAMPGAGRWRTVRVAGTRVITLSPNVRHLRAAELALVDARYINQLPNELWLVDGLETLRVERCPLLRELPNFGAWARHADREEPWARTGGVSDAHMASARQFGNSPVARTLVALHLRGCSALHTLPEDIGLARNLTLIDVRGCTALRRLPKSLEHLAATGSVTLMMIDPPNAATAADGGGAGGHETLPVAAVLNERCTRGADGDYYLVHSRRAPHRRQPQRPAPRAYRHPNRPRHAGGPGSG
jgi:hypothetical protein